MQIEIDHRVENRLLFDVRPPPPTRRRAFYSRTRAGRVRKRNRVETHFRVEIEFCNNNSRDTGVAANHAETTNENRQFPFDRDPQVVNISPAFLN